MSLTSDSWALFMPGRAGSL